MSEDIIEIKPGVGPFKLNLNALIRRIRGIRPSGADVVAQRFLQLFEAHGVQAAQIPRFLPVVTLASLRSNEALLAVLTPDTLTATARLFGIQRAWLEGATDRLYRTHTCYKQPAALFRLLDQVPYESSAMPVRALTSAETLNYGSTSTQPLALLIVEKLADVQENIDEIWDIERYHIFGDTWDWSYFPCRIQLKAMVRVIDQVLHQPVPLFRVSRTELDAVLEGRRVPRAFVNNCLLTEPSLEDYSCSLAEHAKAKETAEQPQIMEYIEYHHLDSLRTRLR